MFEAKKLLAEYYHSAGKRFKNSTLFIVKIFSNPERFFIIFTAFFGLLFIFLVPPMQAPDEQAHFYRGYQTSDLDLFADKFTYEGEIHYGYALPTSVYDASERLRVPVAGNPALEFDIALYKSSLKQALDKQNRMMVMNDAGNAYTPVVYVPQAIGIGVAKVLNAPPIVLIWSGRLTNLAFWIFVVTLAIRFFPFAKWGLVILALNPVTLSIAASLSADVVNIGLAFLFVSLVLSTRKSGVNLTSRKLLFIAVLALVLCLTKPINVALVPLLLLIPRAKMKGTKKYLLYVGGVIAGGVSLGFAWNMLTQDIINTAVQTQRPGYGVDPSGQLKLIVSEPFQYLQTIIRNFITVDNGSSADAVVQTYFGVFGWLDTRIPMWTQLLYWSALVVGVLYQFGRGLVLSFYQKALLLGIFSVAFVGSITAMYMNYTPVGARIFEGVQGRYFMPASIALLPIFSGPKKILVNVEKKVPIILALTMLVVLSMMAVKIYARYY